MGLVTATEKTPILESTGITRRRRGWTPTRLAPTLGIDSPSLFTLPARSSCHPSHVYIYCERFFSRKPANGCPLTVGVVTEQCNYSILVPSCLPGHRGGQSGHHGVMSSSGSQDATDIGDNTGSYGAPGSVGSAGQCVTMLCVTSILPPDYRIIPRADELWRI